MGKISLFARDLKWIWVKSAAKRKKRDSSVWVFGEWFGSRCCDNSLYFANYIASRRPDYECYWIGRKGLDASRLNEAVTVLEMDSDRAREILSRAGVAIYNQGLLDFSTDRGFYTAGAINVNLWHGVPWKHLGLDIYPSANAVRKAYRAHMMRVRKPDYFLALSPDFEAVLQSAYLSNGLDTIRAGYPRNACFYHDDAIQSMRNRVVESLGIEGKGDVTIIAYMPTFRDSGSRNFSFFEMSDNDRLHNILKTRNAIIVEKGHFVDEERFCAEKPHVGVVYSANGLSGQELLCAADLLITDYSSCFFDYLLLDRPIVHFLYDYDEYTLTSRGLYYRTEDVLCGDMASSVDELLSEIISNLDDPRRNQALRAERREHYLAFETEESCEVIYQRIQEELDRRE